MRLDVNVVDDVMNISGGGSALCVWIAHCRLPLHDTQDIDTLFVPVLMQQYQVITITRSQIMCNGQQVLFVLCDSCPELANLLLDFHLCLMTMIRCISHSTNQYFVFSGQYGLDFSHLFGFAHEPDGLVGLGYDEVIAESVFGNAVA